MRLVVFVCMALWLASSDAHSTTCRREVRLLGEPSLVRELGPILADRGLALETLPPPPGDRCSAVVAEIRRGGERVLVLITLPDGRRSERMAEDVHAAATVIESWAREDLVGPLLASRALPGGPTVLDRPATVPGAADTSSAFVVMVGLDAGVSEDKALWGSVRAHGCAMIGRGCLGGTIRFGVDLERTGNAASQGNTRRTLDLVLTGEFPARIAGLGVTPGIGIGQASVTASRIDPTDQALEREQASALHADVSVAVAVPIGRAISLRIDASVGVAPFARRQLGDMIDPADRLLAASPLVQAWFGIALSYGRVR